QRAIRQGAGSCGDLGFAGEHHQLERRSRLRTGVRHHDRGVGVLYGIRGVPHGPEAPEREPVDEISSLFDLSGRKGPLPVAPIALIVLGVVLLLHTLNFLDFYYIARYWPVLLILAGAYLLYLRVSGNAATGEVGRERP